MPIPGKSITAEQARVFLPGTRVANRDNRIGTVILPSQEMLEQCTSGKHIPVQWDDVGSIGWTGRRCGAFKQYEPGRSEKMTSLRGPLQRRLKKNACCLRLSQPPG